MGNIPFDHNEYDNNLYWTTASRCSRASRSSGKPPGPNLAPNPGFEEGEPGKLPAGWNWQVRPGESKAALDADAKFAGRQSLRIEGRGTTKDSKGRELSPNFVSGDITGKTGQFYRLTRASAPPSRRRSLR